MSRQRKGRTKFHVGGLQPSQLQGDTSMHFLTSGRNAQSRIHNVAPTAALSTRVSEEDLAEWMPFLDLADDELVAIAQTISSEPQPLGDDELSGKRKRTTTASDDPMALWRQMIPAYLGELLRGEALGKDHTRPSCAACGERLCETPESRAFRCADCSPFVQCEDCLRQRHEQLPLLIAHRFGRDSGADARFFGLQRAKRIQVLEWCINLATMDLHARILTGECERWWSLMLEVFSRLTSDFALVALVSGTGTHSSLNFSTTPDLFRMLKVVGNMNAHDFDRYKAFGRMSRQYDFLLRAKRAGRGHVQDGLAETPPGGLAVCCWACPDPKRNLPEGWETVDSSKSYIYSLMLALDANFRLKNRIRGNERHDPSLGSGLGYFVELNEYKEHLRHYVAEEDVSTCIAFAALMQKETRLTTGLRVSGVGDLQKGERYANMDWVFLKAVGGVELKRLVVSYDIACQWKQHIRERAKKLGDKEETIVTKLDDYTLQFALPVWHAVAHETSCQAANSLTHAVGVGRTDGEGIERTWAILNPIAFSTKEMGEGNRHDTIEDKVDHVNFEKNVRQGDTLARKMIIALAQRDTQIGEFAEVDDSLDPVLRADWQRRIDAWNADNTRPNPYLSEARHAGPSEAQILADLKKAETTAAAFIKGALQLEDQQRRIRFEASGTTTLTAERSSQLDELRVSVLKKLRTLQTHQLVFMPGIEGLRLAEEENRNPDIAPPAAEVSKLWLPSDLSAEEREAICRPDLVETEAQLRLGQCSDSLGKIRGHLHAKTHLIDTRNANAVGQSLSTRFGTLIGRVGDQARRQAVKYREVRAALVRLKGPDFAPQFHDLQDDDLRVHVESASDAQARAALGKLGSSRRARNEPSVTKKMLPVSWIWFTGGEADDDELHDSVRVQWTKCRARRDRWIEEVNLLREEMRRVVKSVEVVQEEWRDREQGRVGGDSQLTAGLIAYAKRQAFVYGEVEKAFRASWSSSGVAAIRAVALSVAPPAPTAPTAPITPITPTPSLSANVPTTGS
ncbi:CxC2 domain-containing protein [Mycena indigotica]|uniref:CxC2 domain-containing protein n=1 Tax=Mycena indigotica TaxID=2126181 RepID=A0A8H6S1H5_9AGAR|nr:CxC2 domain-containing protein [Mycena indigotica]KAF7290707.1 CxC2 domain-containing protein [Mycena indigotica]